MKSQDCRRNHAFRVLWTMLTSSELALPNIVLDKDSGFQSGYLERFNDVIGVNSAVNLHRLRVSPGQRGEGMSVNWPFSIILWNIYILVFYKVLHNRSTVCPTPIIPV